MMLTQKQQATIKTQIIKSQNIEMVLDPATEKWSASVRDYGTWKKLNWSHEKCLQEIEARKDKLKIFMEVEMSGFTFRVEQKLTEVK